MGISGCGIRELRDLRRRQAGTHRRDDAKFMADHTADRGNGSGRLLVNQNDGTIRIVSGGTVLTTPFLELTQSQMFNGSAMSGLCFAM